MGVVKVMNPQRMCQEASAHVSSASSKQKYLKGKGVVSMFVCANKVTNYPTSANQGHSTASHHGMVCLES